MDSLKNEIEVETSEKKNKKSLIFEKWPEYDEDLIKENKIKLAIQINGKVRDFINLKLGKENV